MPKWSMIQSPCEKIGEAFSQLLGLDTILAQMKDITLNEVCPQRQKLSSKSCSSK